MLENKCVFGGSGVLTTGFLYIFLNSFDVLILKIIFFLKIKNIFFNIFLSENILRNNLNHYSKHPER